jgi:hypothetical protein
MEMMVLPRLCAGGWLVCAWLFFSQLGRAIDPGYYANRFKEHHVLVSGSSMAEVDDLSLLADDLVYARGQVSLVADPKDQGGGFMAVYLINDTKEPLKGAVFELNHPIREVRTDIGWERSHTLVQDCGTVGPPSDLAPGHALVSIAWGSSGDLSGEMRFVYYLSKDLRVVSQVLPCRYKSEDLQDARQEGRDFVFESVSMPGPRPLPEVNARSLCWSPEEYIALLELIRTGDPAEFPRKEAERWLAEPKDKESWPLEFEPALRAVLSRKWIDYRNPRQLFLACADAVKSGSESDKAYGSPARNKAVAWRLLGHYFKAYGRHLSPGESADGGPQLPGNPWDATPEEIAALVALAKERAKDPDSPAAKAADDFLRCGWVEANGK